ncbi:hypothetical protein HQ865_10045 [Mucilaginibacter mali]|uniref:HEAT repeat domain-containing protein n=1 Tax=Mucilaginibacter mali TaxID=2740462 RepID=A0A7D4QAN6_9SPHI|nr:hypothetical protein [Mucilaginibacter mali]QKJ30084.1 hypothetical protein HQ865_10045 [Mucilaginibacter mali]
MDNTELIEKLANTMGKTKVLKLSNMLAEDNFDIAQLIGLTFHPEKVIGFRAAWLLENMYPQDQDSFIPHIPLLVSKFKEVTNPSCQRHYAKILMQLTDRKAPKTIKEKIAETNLEPAIEQCFDWLIDPEVLVAVKVHAAEALFNVRMRYTWINDELPEQLQFLMRDGTMAIQTRGKRLLSQLKPVKKAW